MKEKCKREWNIEEEEGEKRRGGKKKVVVHLDAEFAVEHPQGARIFTRASLFRERNVAGPWAAVSAAVDTRVGVGRRRRVQQSRQARLVVPAIVHLEV